jgi:hypothetical protein
MNLLLRADNRVKDGLHSGVRCRVEFLLW